MGPIALVSGGSGFLGSYIVAELLRADFERIYVLMRGCSDDACAERLRKLWWERAELRDALGEKIIALAGDICQEDLGLEASRYETLCGTLSHIVHAAAEVGVNQTPEQFARINVDGTTHMLELARKARKQGVLERFLHISTAYVAGTQRGVVHEDTLPQVGFNSLYEQSKHGAEQLVRDCAELFPVSIVRPAQIVGDTETGFVQTFNTLYYPLKLYLKGQLPLVPASETLRVNMVPVDCVAQIAVQALLAPEAAGKTFHALTPTHMQPKLSELLEAVRAWAKENLRFDPGQARFLPLSAAGKAGRARNLASSSTAKLKSPVQNMLALAPYFSEERIYSTRNVSDLLDIPWPDWHDYLPVLLGYAVRKGFLNHTDRTVFEQMLVRLGSKRNTINYFDVSADGTRHMGPTEAKDAIERAARVLLERGLGLGDRIALVGVNSSRYFISDAAIGLVGATSVPLYYTSPVNDIVDLVKESGAKLIFVGTEKLARELPGALDIPMVNLNDAAFEGLEGWEDFLASGSATAGQLSFPSVPFDAVATIRYTSGTTGKPKGVTFTQAQLRWMGEVMPALLDWQTRNDKLRYLSFLPMSHVIEGILVSYAPYYILSDIEFYYLRDFPMLAEKLPEVRPSLFFSVPRFYEKVWNQFEASGVGKRYLAMKDGPAKRALAKVARAGLLRKAGLDNCKQLLVGSAPVSMDLLEAFRALGIEIHNAYGVTEAPLISLSRLGENELGSVGALLPETQAKLSGEGEILIAGPQVAAGYDGLGPCVDEQGFFATGDFGSYSEAGHLVIGGRKKELLVTSYGKNISPEKVETMLKSIPGVSEALLVGEARPYVAALLWMEEGTAFDAEALDGGVLAMNERLSHPEQVKRWIVMKPALSIAEGDLTPNLKLRRRAVGQRYAPVIDAIYADDFPASMPDSAAHIGAAQ